MEEKLETIYITFGNGSNAIQWLINRNLIKEKRICGKCRKTMVLYPESTEDGYIWYYKTNICKGKKISIRKGSFFDGFRLSIKTILLIFYFYCKKQPRNMITKELKISKNSYEKVLAKFRKKINDTYNQKIGGENLIVEIDESLITKRKNNIGRDIQRLWCVGGICRTTKIFF